MKFFIETERLVLRDLLPEDHLAFFALDSDPDVMKYIGVPPVTDIEQTKKLIDFVRKQYTENGIGRWAVVLKSTNEVIGWAGLKLIKEETNDHINFYDVGYRLLKSHWGKGYASEAALASLKYGFETMQLKEIYGYAMNEHIVSKKVLEKAGLKFVNNFYNDGIYDAWYKITKEEYFKLYPVTR
jgi:[ribosomal protein S5]-alanine N-acetyltransferase